MQQLLHSHIAMLIRRIALLYLVLALCRVEFYIYNYSTIGALGWSEGWELLRGSLLFDTASIIYANALFVILSLLPTHLRERRWWRATLRWYYVVVNSLLIVVANFADSVYFRYTLKRLTSEEIFFASNDNSLQLIGQFLAENWFLLPTGALLIATLYFGYGHRVREASPLKRGTAYYSINTIIFIIAIGLSVAGIRGGFTRATRPITLSNATLYTADSKKANLILSNPFAILRTTSSSNRAERVHYLDDAVADSLFSPTHTPKDSTMYNLKGRNVVIFIMESFSAEHSAYLTPEAYEDRATKGFTPFLDSLMREGLTFTNHYANGTRSIQALSSVLGSIPSFKTPFVLMPQSLGESRQLPAILAEDGYSTAFFCGSERGSMGFGAYARQAGVERLYSREDYEARHGTDSFDGYWGIWDEPFIAFMGEELSTMPQPFFASIFTLSSHHPFVVPEEYQNSLPKGYTKVHQGVAYTDNAIREFFERYKESEWMKSTIFVFVADHVSSEKFMATTQDFPQNHHIIGFIYTPDHTAGLKGTISQSTQQLDIMPTLLGLLGSDEEYFAFGRDILNEPEREAWAVMYDTEYKALSNNAIVTIDNNGASVSPRSGVNIDSLNQKDQTNKFKALIQQYYRSIDDKRYLPND